LLDRLARLVGAAASAGPEGTPAPAPERTAGRQRATYRIRFRPEAGLLATGTNPLLLLDELRGLGPCRVVAQTDALPPLDELDPQECHTYWDVVLTTDRGENAIRDVFIFVEGEGELRVDLVDDGEAADGGTDYKKLGDILVERGDLTTDAMQAALREQKRFGEILEEKKMVAPGKVEAALAEQQAVREVRRQREEGEAAANVRVSAERLDQLVDLVGELVIAQARLSQTAGHRQDAVLLGIAEEVERLTAELRDNTLGIRMLPIGTTFGRFRRLVRDLSAELGKDIELVTEGAETELDKTVIERLADPLVHLIRNSIDHGIESPEQRRAAGKPARGTVRLAAEHAGANVVIRISDDGAGLNASAIRAKAVERGLLAADAQPSEQEIFQFILAPGFSTARTVSSVSGRGVGMDVVKRSVESLRGSLELNAAAGCGTQVTIKLPLTLAIIEGLLVQVEQEQYVLPLSLVEECVELTQEESRRARRMAPVRGHLVPYVRLREWFSLPGSPPEIEQIVIVSLEGSRYGLVVDHVVGQHQTVIKNLGRFYRGAEGLSGATILGDGQVALILDAKKILDAVAAGCDEATRGPVDGDVDGRAAQLH
ncbi:MAG: chemotaxis protein CheA, partial [Proteobacteria bacterium]|nr:chemotaxis protein CheA [Pseudomonadota bacterium]